MWVVIIVSVLFIGVGAYGVFYGYLQKKKVDNAQNSDEYREVEGVVTDFREVESYDSDTGGYSIAYYPMIEYEVNGTRYTYTEKVGTSSRRRLGKRYTMLYSIHDPSDAVKKGDKVPLVMIGASVAFFLIGLVLLFTQIK